MTTLGESASRFMLLLQLASPALPVGGFSYSEGLESAVELGWITDEASAKNWLVDQLHLIKAWSEMPLLQATVHAWRSFDQKELHALTAWTLQTRETFEVKLQTEQMGRSLLIWLRNQNIVDDERIDFCNVLPPTWPIVFALCVSAEDISLKDGLMTYAFSWAENMVQAAMKSVPLGQKSGQAILTALTREIPQAVEMALSTFAEKRQSFAPHLAILSALHETQYSRLFRS
jgi:urease accessory protein